MKTTVSFILAFGATTLAIAANDRAQFLSPIEDFFPEQGILHDYSIAVKETLVREAGPNSPAVMITLPSFSPESIVFIAPKEGKMFIQSATMKKQIWASRVMVEPGQKKQEIGIKISERELSEKVANQVAKVLAQATSHARPRESPNLGRDGVIYIFSSTGSDYSTKSGQTWSPEPETVCGRQVALGDHMAERSEDGLC